MSTGPLYDRRFAAVCNTADRDAINAALAEVSGNYAQLFSLPCLYENDADPLWDDQANDWDWSGTTIRKYSTGILLTTPTMRDKIKPVVQQWLTSADWKEIDSRGPRFPDEYDLFLAHYQLRRNGGFVNATGLLRARGALPSQTLTATAQLVNQWDNLEQIRNTQLDGTGQRIQVDFAGRYEVEAHVDWDEELTDSSTISFQLNMDASPIGPIIQRTETQTHAVQGKVQVDFPTNSSKLGLGVWADNDGVEFKITNGWIGTKRIE